MGKEQGINVRKPARQLTERLEKLIDTVSRKQNKLALNAAFSLLDVPLVNQRNIEKEFDKVKARVRANLHGRSMEDALCFEAGSIDQRFGVVLFAVGDRYWNEGKEKVYEVMESLAGNVLAESNAECVFVFAVHVDLQALPYSLFAAYDRPVAQDG